MIDGQERLQVRLHNPADRTGDLKALGGSASTCWNTLLLDQALKALWKHQTPDERQQQADATTGALIGIGPKDEIEGMLAGQLLAAHNAAMECYRRAMVADQPLPNRAENLSQANKLSRTSAALIEALNRHRGKGQQKVTVEHVHVHPGGQAVVGLVERGGGDGEKSIERCQTAGLGDAALPALLGEDPSWASVPVASDAERAVPDAWREA